MSRAEQVSIIVPIYKVEKYLNKCIDSILAQTFTDFELILVDDGSPDNCGKICDEYAEKDSRIKVIHQVNSGVSSARNTGLKTAKGKYVGFVDPDDYLEPEFYEKMTNLITRDDTDLVICGVRKVFEDGKCAVEKLTNNKVSAQNAINELFDVNGLNLRPSVWNKLFKTEMIGCFDEKISVSEDLKFCVEYLLKCKNVSYIEQNLYNNVQRNGSLTKGGINELEIVNTVKTNEYVYRLVKRKYKNEAKTVCYWTFQDSIGWMRYLFSIEAIKNAQNMKKLILKRKHEVFFNKCFSIKEKVAILLGIF